MDARQLRYFLALDAERARAAFAGEIVPEEETMLLDALTVPAVR